MAPENSSETSSGTGSQVSSAAGNGPKNYGNAPWLQTFQLVLGLGLTFLFFYMMAPYVLAILFGAVLAILVYPLYEPLKRKLPRPIAAFITTVGLTVGILAPLAFVLYTAIYRVFVLINRFKLVKEGQTIEDIADLPIIKKTITAIGRWVPLDREWVNEQGLNLVQSTVAKTSGVIGDFFAGMPGLLIGFTVTILSLYFFLSDGALFLRFLGKISPLKQDRSRELYQAFERSCRGVILGLFMSAIAQGLLMALLFLITGLPYPFLIGFVTIICGMVPLVGSSPIWIAAVVYFASHASWPNFTIALIGGILISVIDNIVRPWVMKGQAEMHPLLALVSVFGAVRLLGPPGIFLGPVIAAVFISFLKIVSLEKEIGR